MRASEFLSEAMKNELTIMSLDRFVQTVGPEETEDEEDLLADGSLIGEELTEAEFGLGAKFRSADAEEMRKFLKSVVRKKAQRMAKEKPSDEEEVEYARNQFNMPFVHPSNVKIVDEEDREIDLDSLRKNIIKRPSTLLKKNEKMQHSDGTATQYFNIGLPALKGLAVNEETDEFVIVNTCPGAGACKVFCYAKKGNYVMFKDVSMLQTQTLNFLLNDPEGFAERLKTDIRKAIKKYQKDNVDVVIRWHDAGDFFSPEYMDLAFDVASTFPNNDFYAYTKIASVAKAEKPENFKINFSSGALPTQEKQVNLTQIKHSIVVPKEMFRGKLFLKDKKWQWISSRVFNEFKQALANRYNINPKSILTYDEFLKKPEGTEPIWNVIVKPGEGDTSANSSNVLGTYLLFH